MPANSGNREHNGMASQSADGALGRNLSRRGLFGAGALLGLAAIALPTERAFAWASWTNITSPLLKRTGMGDCVHEDLVQIAYARMLRSHRDDTGNDSLLNPWAGTLQDDRRSATIAGDLVDAGNGKTFADANDLAARLFRENLAYLRIGSFWNDAAANTLADFGVSCFNAESIPKFSGDDYYTGAWDVGQHIWETNEHNKKSLVNARDALVQFTMNERNNFIHGMLTSTASHSGNLRQSDVKKYALQWLGVAYEYARTGTVTATSDVTQEQAEKIFKGFIDTYGQLDENAHGMSMSLKVGWSEASIKLPRRRLRLRALGMMCHTLEDLWCPAHTCRTYHDGGSIPRNAILSFNNYKMQNGAKMPMFGYHIPFDRYAVADAKNSTDWREALTRGKGEYKGTETLANVLDDGMGCLEQADTYFNTLGMNETITCITTLFEYLYQGTAWDEGVRAWVDADVMPTYFDGGGQSFICDAGRRCLHTPTYLIAPIKSLKRAYKKAGLSSNYDAMLAASKSYDAWQRGAHRFYSGKFNTGGSKLITSGNEGSSIWADSVGMSRLEDLVGKVRSGYGSLSSDKQNALLASISCNGCHDMVSALGMMEGMLQEFSVDLTGSLRASDDATLKELNEARAFFESGLRGQGSKVAAQSEPTNWLLAADVAFADEGNENYVTTSMAFEDYVSFEDGSYLIAVRDLDSLETSIMVVPDNTPGKDRLEEGLANLTITYTLEAEFEGDLDYRYVVTNIDHSDVKDNVYLVTGTVKSVSADAKGLVLDWNGLGEFPMAIRAGLSDMPQAGQYICAQYAVGNPDLELVDFYELDAPGEIYAVTYPVEKVAGSNLWLLTNESDPDSGQRNYLQIDYGSADVRTMPQEGHYVTVYYHDEAYGDATGTDEIALAAAGTADAAGAEEPAGVEAQNADDELTDSATPGYVELGDDYGNLEYGNEVFHVANVIMGSSAMPDNSPVTRAIRAEKTPRAGDLLAGLGGLLSVTAAAGAAMAAYSARRTANERADAED